MNVYCLTYLIPIAAFGAASSISLAQASGVGELTTAEQAQINSLAVKVERLCSTQVAARFKENAAYQGNGKIPDWVSKLTSGNHCSCIAQRIRTTATPEMIRHGTEADGRLLVQKAANECAMETFKTIFPEICHAWTNDLPVEVQTSGITPEKREQACQCVQRRLDGITAETLAVTARESIADYVQWKRKPNEVLQSGAWSIMGDVMSCYRTSGLVLEQSAQPINPPDAAR